MPTPRPRADVELLEQLVLGRLPVAEADRLAVEYADDSRLAELAAAAAGRGDTLLDALRHHPTVEDSTADRLIGRLIQRLDGRSKGPDTSSGPLGETAGGGAGGPADLSPMPERLEYFRIHKVLGQGGMGTVYLADDTRLGRRVALKTLKRELAANPTAKDRFFREARSAARLDHDHIIPIYYVGEADGTPFLAMPFLQGEPLDERLKREGADDTDPADRFARSAGQAKPLPIPETLRIARQVALGLSAAHGQGLVHRDIKPGNVWLEAPTGRVKLLDFGLARSQTEAVHLTASGAIMGTPAYMAPEQARGKALDHRADLFSLGVMLFEMTTGQRPFRGENTMAILTSLALDEPTPPEQLNPEVSPALSALILKLLAKAPENRPADAGVVADALMNLMMGGSRPVVEALPVGAGGAGDPWQNLDEEPAAASPVRRAAKARREAPPTPKAAPRQRQPRWSNATLAVAAAAAIVFGGGLAVYKLVFETKDGTLIVEVDGDADVGFKNGELQVRDADGTVKYTLKPGERSKAMPPGSYKVAVVGADGVKLETDKFEMTKAGKVTLRVTAAPAGAAVRTDGPKAVAVAPPPAAVAGAGPSTGGPSGWENLFNGRDTDGWTPMGFNGWTVKDNVLVGETAGPTGWLMSNREFTDFELEMEFKLSPGSNSGVFLRAWPEGDVNGGEFHEIQLLDDAAPAFANLDPKTKTGALFNQIAPTPAPKAPADSWNRLRVVVRGSKVRVGINGGQNVDGELPKGRPAGRIGLQLYPTRLEFKNIRVRGLANVSPGNAEATTPAVSAIAGPSPFDKLRRADIPPHELLAAGDGDPDKAPKELVAVIGESRLRAWRPIFGTHFTADGKRIVTFPEGGARGTVWDAATGRQIGTVPTFEPDAQLPTIGADGRLAVSRGENLVVLDGTTGKELFVSPNPKTRIRSAAFSPDGKWLVKGCDDTTLQICDGATGKLVRTFKGHTHPIHALAFSTDGKRLASSASTREQIDQAPGEVKEWDFGTGKELFALTGHPLALVRLVFSPDGRHLAGVEVQGTVHVWDARTGRKISATTDPGGPGGIVFSHDGRRLFRSRFYGSQIDVFSPETGKLETSLPAPYGIWMLALSPDGTCLAAGGHDQSIWVWDAATLQPTLKPSGVTLWCVAVSPDGRWVALGGQSKEIRLWDVAAGKVTRTMSPPVEGIAELAFSPDNRRIASISIDGAVHVWGVEDAQAAFDFQAKGHNQIVYNRDGSRLATFVNHDRGEGNLAVKVYDARTGEAVCVFRSAHGAVRGSAFSPDGRTAASACPEKAVVVLWDAATGQELHTFQADWKLEFEGVKFAPDGKCLIGSCEKIGFSSCVAWDLESKKRLWALPTQMANGYSPDGKRLLVSNNRTGEVATLNAITQDEVRRWKLPEPVWGARFTGDGRHVVTNNPNTTAYVLRVAEAPIAVPPVADPDRRAAEWVLSVGGTVVIVHNGKERHPTAVGDLPREAFVLGVVSLEANQKVTDAGLAHFKDCKNLVDLDLTGTQVADAGLAHFKDCKELASLGLTGTQLSDAGLAHFNDCKNLTHIYLGGTQLSDAGLAHFKDRKNLMLLHLGNTKVSDTGLAYFKDNKNLSSLDLRNTKVSDAGLVHFKECKNLAKLQLYGPLVSDAGLAHFKDCENLTYLDLGLTKVSDAGLVHFKDCKNLTVLRLQNTKVTAAGIDGLKKALPQCKIEWDGGPIEPKNK